MRQRVDLLQASGSLGSWKTWTVARAGADAISCQTLRHAVTRRTLLRACLAAGTVQTLPGCRSTPSPTCQEAPRAGITLYLIAFSWHTEIALPIDTIHDPLRTVTPDFPGAQYLSFGNYYMARAPTLSDAMSALFPGSGVLLVTIPSATGIAGQFAGVRAQPVDSGTRPAVELPVDGVRKVWRWDTAPPRGRP
jgi:hypothetical protein